MNRINNIDILRGIASLMVAWFHMTNTYEMGIVRLSGHYMWLGLEIFFVLSGFIIPYAMYRSNYILRKDYGTFLLKRIIRIEPPYIIAMLSTLGLLYLSALMPGFQGTFPDITLTQTFLHFGYLNAIFGYSWFNPVFWTLAIEFQFYLLISIIFPLLIFKKVLVRDLVLLILCTLPFLINKDIFVFHFLCLFVIGILTFQYLVKIISIKKYFILLIIVGLFCYLSLGILITVVALMTSLSIIFLKIKEFKILSFLGTISYSLYLVHIPVGGRVINIGKRFLSTELEFFILSIIAIITSIVFAYYFYKYIEQPAMKLASRIKY